MVKINKNQSVYETFVTNNTKVTQHRFQNSVWETSINGEIEDTKQGDAGDCWLLTHINGLRDTKWGKKLIKNAIKPDGAGGAVITFKGAKGEQKEFHISVNEIIKARESGIYSSGDDDMIAMELAVEKYLIKFGHLYEDRKQDIGTESGKAITGNGLSGSEFVELLSGKQTNTHYALPPQSNFMDEGKRSYNEKLRMLTEVEKHPGEYLVEVSFQGNSIDGVMHGQHAYQVKKVITEGGKKYAILVNPWNSSENIQMELDKLIYYSDLLSITENPDAKPNPNLRSDLEKDTDDKQLLIDMLDELVQKVRDGKIKDTDLNKVKKAIEAVNSENIKDLFSDKNTISFIINCFDLIKHGWGNGKEKKELIAPLVDDYCEYAAKKGVEEDIIKDVKTACYKELDALLYTDEKVIIEKLQILFDKIKEKDNWLFNFMH